jgi:hypothetical protein
MPCVEFVFLKTVVMKNTISWDVTLWSPMKVIRGFRKKIYIQCRRISQVRRQQSELVSNVDPEDEGEILLRNVG